MSLPLNLRQSKAIGRLLMAKELFRLHKSSGLIVSSEGKVLNRCQDNRFFRFTYGFVNHSGYMFVRHHGKSYAVHRLIAEAFIPNPEHKKTVDHIDRNRANNNVFNLRWATYQEQIINSTNFKDRAMWKRSPSRRMAEGKVAINVILPDGRRSMLHVQMDLAESIYALPCRERYERIMEVRNENSV